MNQLLQRQLQVVSSIALLLDILSSKYHTAF